MEFYTAISVGISISVVFLLLVEFLNPVKTPKVSQQELPVKKSKKSKKKRKTEVLRVEEGVEELLEQVKIKAVLKEKPAIDKADNLNSLQTLVQSRDSESSLKSTLSTVSQEDEQDADGGWQNVKKRGRKSTTKPGSDSGPSKQSSSLSVDMGDMTKKQRENQKKHQKVKDAKEQARVDQEERLRLYRMAQRE